MTPATPTLPIATPPATLPHTPAAVPPPVVSLRDFASEGVRDEPANRRRRADFFSALDERLDAGVSAPAIEFEGGDEQPYDNTFGRLLVRFAVVCLALLGFAAYTLLCIHRG